MCRAARSCSRRWKIRFPLRLEEVKRLRERTKIIFVDFHAEATSEKIAFGRYLDGQVSAVVGTHTHVQTADEQIFPGGTAYLTDAGFTGPHEGCLGPRNRAGDQKIPHRHAPAV